MSEWIHNFAITETCIVKNQYTLYKITSIVFPQHIPEALSTVSVWKRFSEIKELYKEVENKRRRLHLKGDFPFLKQTTFFNRFNAVIIEERKAFILDLLYFIALNSSLYTSKKFGDFLRNGHNTPSISPKKHILSNSIHAAPLAQPMLPSTMIADQNQKHAFAHSPSPKAMKESPLLDSPIPKTASLPNSPNNKPLKPQSIQINDNATEKTQCLNNNNDNNLGEIKTVLGYTPSNDNISSSSDYVLKAALEFAAALEAEVNGNFVFAFEAYKQGIDFLLAGVKCDPDVERKRVVKQKMEKYLRKAEYIYDNYISNERRNVELSPVMSMTSSSSGPIACRDVVEVCDLADATDGSGAVSLLERPISQLSKLKVIKIINNVMQVLDITNKNCYIMKVIPFKLSSRYQRTIMLSKNIPYMVQIVQFYKTENCIYILLKQACGGRLWDYIENYGATTETIRADAEQQEDTFSNCVTNVIKEEEAAVEEPEEQIVVEMIPDEQEKQNEQITQEELKTTVTPYETLSSEMDIEDLLSCSQKLLNSVSETLNQVKIDETKSIETATTIQTFDMVQPSATPAKHICRISYENSLIAAPTLSHRGVGMKMEHIYLPECSVRQWAKELIVAVEQLHKNNIICGDLNMDNLLLGSDGQLQLTFFYRRIDNDLEFDVIANAEGNYCSYIAPDRPLTIMSDWWSVGVILFELLTLKQFRFCHPGEILNYFDVQFCDAELSIEAKHLIEGLLQIDPLERFDVMQIKSHPFFADTNWDDVSRKGYNFI